VNNLRRWIDRGLLDADVTTLRERIRMSALIFLAATLASATGRPDLGGRVLDASGDPVAGARVMMYTAGARVGVNPFCPSCYADCGKSAETGDDGSFLIRSLDPSLIFRVLVVSEGYDPTFVEKVDPRKGPIEARLSRLDPKRYGPRHSIRGRVIDPGGSPVVGARVWPIEFKTEAYSGFAPGIVDPLAVTNLRGEFALTSRSPAEHISVRVNARGLAPHVFSKLPPGDAVHELRLGRGVGVTGRVLRDGKPLPGVVVGMVQSSRIAWTFLGSEEIATDGSGRFLFSNVAPDENYRVYGIMNSLKTSGSVRIVQVQAGGDGTTADVGDLAVGPGHRLSGRIVLSDGKPIPAHTRVSVSRNWAWDRQMTEVDGEGRFTFEGLPSEIYSVYSPVQGYRLSPKNECASPYNPGSLEGRVDRDVSDLTVLYEPGERLDPEFGAAAVNRFDARKLGLIGGVDPRTGRP